MYILMVHLEVCLNLGPVLS